jgi:hypothetical protein
LSEERVRERFHGTITSDAGTVAMSVVDAQKPTDSNYTEIKARGVRSAISTILIFSKTIPLSFPIPSPS